MTAAYCLLRDLADMVGPSAAASPTAAALASVQATLSTVMPFGAPVESQPRVVEVGGRARAPAGRAAA